ncbi:MAG: GNAT family N-acetyltransferase [Planctomycetota bacterium]|nr:MAG: GNAT family N-acetyltransferase [Planctomycetota bacterium]
MSLAESKPPGPPPLRTTEPGIMLRSEVLSSDRDAVRRIITSSGFFHDFEVDVAVELVDDRLARGDRSDYRFVFLERAGSVAGYACYGPIACTVGSFDLYWIAVDAVVRGTGLGRALLAEVERRIDGSGGRNIYIETSSRPLYEPTRAFYQRCGYRLEARLSGFYAPDDDKLIYVKTLPVG